MIIAYPNHGFNSLLSFCFYCALHYFFCRNTSKGRAACLIVQIELLYHLMARWKRFNPFLGQKIITTRSVMIAGRFNFFVLNNIGMSGADA